MKYGLIGKTLVHSYSKEIHEALGKYQYDLFSLPPEELSGFIAARDFGGLNITIPYKQDVMPLCDEVSELAAAIGAVNTLYWGKDADAKGQAAASGPKAQPGTGGKQQAENMENAASVCVLSEPVCDADGAPERPAATPNTSNSYKLVGHNTDYEGFLYTAARAGIDFAGKTVLILGTGGTSLMARKAAADQGAAKILIASRSKHPHPQDTAMQDAIANPAACAEAENPQARRAAVKKATATKRAADDDAQHACQQLTYGELPAIAAAVDIIVNTTPVGTFPNNLESIISLADFPNCTAVIDVIYNPFKTKLLLEAEKRGLRYANGLPMLVAQATAAAGYFLGTQGAFYEENERIIIMLAKQMRNIILIGMPGCGKTTIGKILAQKTGKKFVDMDEAITQKSGMPIPQIFEQSGENGFRDLESEIARELGKEHGLVIATGGGVILRPENVDALRQNGFVIHITRPIDALPMDGRPLSKDLGTLQKMEQARMPLYKAAADATFSNHRTLTKAELAKSISTLLHE